MSKAVSDPQFWKNRIDTAVKEHYSVYVITDDQWKRIFEIHSDTIRQVIGDSGRVLDAGCGYGRLAPLFKNYTGVDISPDFIELAQQKYPKKKFLVGDLGSLPFENGSFDWVVCCSVKGMIEGNLGVEAWNRIQRELKRVAGRILILEYGEPERHWIL